MTILHYVSQLWMTESEIELNWIETGTCNAPFIQSPQRRSAAVHIVRSAWDKRPTGGPGAGPNREKRSRSRAGPDMQWAGPPETGPCKTQYVYQLYNTASINRSSARDPSMLFTHVHIKQLQNQSTALSVRQTRLFSDYLEHIFYIQSNLYHKKGTYTFSSIYLSPCYIVDSSLSPVLAPASYSYTKLTGCV